MMEGTIIPSNWEKNTPKRCILLVTIPMMAHCGHKPATDRETQTKHIEYM